MKVAMLFRRYLARSFLSLALLALAIAPAVADEDGAHVIKPNSPNTHALYQSLAADWWNWALSFPLATNPLLDGTGESGHLGQEGPIWYLAGTFGGSATRTLTVPEGKALFFPIINSVFWVPEDGETEDDVRALANANVDVVTVAECTVNGKTVKNIFSQQRVETPGFTLSLPAGAILDELGAYAPGDRFPAVADGYWVLLSPLRAGTHIVRFRGVVGDPDSPAFETEVTYYLIVVPE